MQRRINVIIAIAAVASLGLAACSDEDRDNIGDTADSLVDDIQDAAQSIATDVQGAVDEAATDAAELVVRNVATQQGEEQFADAGHPLNDDGLSCEATVSDGLDTVDVNCTGTTEDGSDAAMTGSTSELPGASVTEIEGTFSGTVDGGEVFTTESLGG